MKERPIIFSANLVRAILEGRKTQTRRVVKPQFHNDALPEEMCATTSEGWQTGGHSGLWWDGDWPNEGIKCPYGKPGDRLWVRETWKEAHPMSFQAGRTGRRLLYAGIPGPPPVHYLVAYRADGEMLPIWHSRDGHPYRQLTPRDDIDKKHYPAGQERGWESPIYMPRVASRITLEITGVRVERLQDITEGDVVSEGFTMLSKDQARTFKFGIADSDGYPGNDDTGWAWADWCGDAKDAYRKLWQSINGPGSWNTNPWVWVIDFNRIEQ